MLEDDSEQFVQCPQNLAWQVLQVEQPLSENLKSNFYILKLSEHRHAATVDSSTAKAKVLKIPQEVVWKGGKKELRCVIYI